MGKEREGVKWEKGEVGEENGERTGRVGAGNGNARTNSPKTSGGDLCLTLGGYEAERVWGRSPPEAARFSVYLGLKIPCFGTQSVL